MNIIDRLIARTIETKNPTVVGLDPDFAHIPFYYKKDAKISGDPLRDVADMIITFNKDIIDTVCDLVPAVKPQMAFYEKYGSAGVYAFEQIVIYAKKRGLVVVEDGKRNDIGNTARAYAEGHLGLVDVLDGAKVPSLDVDFLTVTPFLGSESLKAFLDVCISQNKGIFILVKTSNSSSGEIQDVVTTGGATISQALAEYVAKQSEKVTGTYGYSSIGAVVGATYPEDALKLRKLMPKSYFLVPGYGAQGGNADDIVPCFNPDGLGAIVNSSRGILYTHMSADERNTCSKEEYLSNVRRAAEKMQEEIYRSLKTAFCHMIY